PERREDLGDTVIDTLSEYAPNLKNIILHRQVVTPWDLEQEFGLTEGNIFQGELTLDQLFFLRPVPGWAKYRTPINNLYMCGACTHPGGGVMAASGRVAAFGIFKGFKWIEAVQKYDTICIRGGHKGVVNAAYLGKAGKKVLVLECRSVLGGIAATEEIFPGFKYSTCAHLAGTFSNEIIAELELKKHGLEILPLEPLLLAPLLEGKSLIFPRQHSEIAESIGRHSRLDATKFEPFSALVKKLSGFLRSLNRLPLPGGTNPGGMNLRELVKLGLKFHRLGEREMYEFLRILPMSIADWLNEWFETDVLKASLAASGILGSFVGPRAQGTSFLFLYHQLGESNGAFRTSGFVRGGIGNLPLAISKVAERFGAKIRTGADVGQIIVKNGTAVGVV